MVRPAAIQPTSILLTQPPATSRETSVQLNLAATHKSFLRWRMISRKRAGGQPKKSPPGERFPEMESGRPFKADAKVDEELKAAKLIQDPAPLPWRDAELKYLVNALGLDERRQIGTLIPPSE